ncbi:MAG: M12 family metallo-peptidase, partial [Candidatus Binatia bacterium]
MQSGRPTIRTRALRRFLSVSLRPELLISALRSFLYHSLRVALLTVAAGGVPADAAARAEVVPFTIERAPSGGRAVQSSPPVALRFRAFGRGFRLRLEPNVSLLAPGLEASLVDERGRRTIEVPTPWIGHGDDGSEARLSIRGHDASGYVRTPTGTFVFEPASGGSHRVRRAEDVVADSGPVACGLEDDSEGVQAVAPVAATAIEGEAAHDTMRVLDVSVLADAEYYRRHGSDSVRDLVALFNAVDGVYRSQLGITLQIAQLVVYGTDAAQPFSTTTSAGQFLSELSLARKNDPLLTVGAGGVTHLLTGRTFDEKTVGMAWLKGVCDPLSGSSFTSDTAAGSPYQAAIVVAHEMGHNLGAPHDRMSGGCEDAPAGLIM